ncbi:MAG: peptidoglycan DD-metalloendopeptidase family protein [Candidatus Sericytochromatia bacterium]
MSLQDNSLNPAQASTAASVSDTFFQELDQTFQALWHQEAPSVSASPVPSLSSSAGPQTPPTRQRRRSTRDQRRQALAARQAFALKPLNLPARPEALARTPRRSAALRFPKLSPRAGKVASLAVGMVALSLMGHQLVQAQQQSKELPPIQQVMYQNAQTKVAAFRKEIAEGDHFVADHSEPIQYIAREGDTIEKISHKFHVSPNTIIKNNEPSKIDDILAPGTHLTILPVDGIAHPVEKHDTLAELAKRYKVGIQDIVEANELDNPHMITEKQKIIIPNATELKRRPKPKPKTLAQALNQARTGQTPALAKTQTGRRLSWPAAGIVSSNYGWRWFRMHNGMDVAGPVGTPIKAAKEGRVVYSGWMGGYGYAIDIDHGNGVRTRYGHCSALNVQAGQYVHRGQMIGSMGSTGHSTGPHLHFEVHVNGSAIDPRSYF